ncbi:hypothetical protein WME90_00970 [Sorangium sp. So ce375]|uniref:hypothetical protein n=1 Tax=Sorangium sp. So ce375 TaxID=3133306 RepID=UPI003F5BDA15
MHNRSDQFTKSLLRDGLSLVSAAETEVEVLAATQKIDVYSVPDPARESERTAMGLLGELSAEPSLFEPFHGTPSLRQVRQCLRKQLTWHHELERRARSAARSVHRRRTSTRHRSRRWPSLRWSSSARGVLKWRSTPTGASRCRRASTTPCRGL